MEGRSMVHIGRRWSNAPILLFLQFYLDDLSTNLMTMGGVDTNIIAMVCTDINTTCYTMS